MFQADSAKILNRLLFSRGFRSEGEGCFVAAQRVLQADELTKALVKSLWNIMDAALECLLMLQ